MDNHNTSKKGIDTISPLFTELNPQQADTAKGGCGGFQGERNQRSSYGGLFSAFFQLTALFKNSFNSRSYNGDFKVNALNQANIGDNNNIYIL